MTLSSSLPTELGLGPIQNRFTFGLGSVGFANDGQRFQSVDTTYDPEGQVVQTMPLIQAYATEDAKNPMIQALAARYAAMMPGRSAAEIAWQATKDHMVFRDDQSIAAASIPGVTDFVVEVLRRPVDVLLFNQYEGRKCEGDCDDHSMFCAAIGLALGVDVRFVTVAANPKEPGTLSHIYTEIDGIPCDASHGPMAGWEVPAAHVTRRETWSSSPLTPLWILAAAAAWYVFGPWIQRRLFA